MDIDNVESKGNESYDQKNKAKSFKICINKVATKTCLYKYEWE